MIQPASRIAGFAAAALVAGGLATASIPSPAGAAPQATGYLVGTGIGDMTGEAAEVGMMGYASLSQKTAGIQQRQRARAFIVADQASGKRVAIVNIDSQGTMQAVQQAVIKKLAAKFGSTYDDRNLLITATHTHAVPGGFSHYAMYNITVLGFQEKTFNAEVDGIVDAVTQANGNLKPGTVSLGRSQLTNASAQRSRPAFDKDPAADKANFPLGIDPAMTVMRLKQGGTDVGLISWFATHGTSMSNTNTLISGDNKGYAEYAWEHDREGVRYRDPSSPKFVAAFAQTNAGDMSPNLNLKPTDGPTKNEFDNTRIIGERQDAAAATAYNSATDIGSGVDYRMRYADMSKVTVAPQYTGDGQQHTTCPAALGTGFAAGSTEDGAALDFVHEGESNPFLAAIGGFVFNVSDELKKCQAPKEIVLAVGTTKPYPWSPELLPVQLVRIGSLYLAALPGEATIVSGLRIRRTIAAAVGTSVDNVLIAGYSNAYAGYVATPEEYDVNDYEGGATHFGRWTLPAYQEEFGGLASAMKSGAPAAADDGTPRDLSDKQLNFQTGVVFDTTPGGVPFGTVKTQPDLTYQRGQTAKAEFWTGHPKNNLHRGGTFLEVQRQVNGQWVSVADDGDWSTIYRWARSSVADSIATITWAIPADASPGTYRIVHYGDSKNLLGTITPFTGTSRTFTVS
ncbi:MAG: neutral ceramidase [Cryptosporangiaceae bacterium]|nr:neutral ceramidase [Cryptosporangiaceae bacterium]